MRNNFYKLPIRFDSIFDEKGGDMPMCSEIESIDQHIELLLTTCPGEHKFDKNFGCRIWDMDFERVVSRKQWEDDFKAYVLESTQNYEPRLKNISVNISIKDVTRQDYTLQTTAIKKEVLVYINAYLVSSGEPCSFHFLLYLGPLSID
jgi:phage baseplate assembly protein W